MAMTDPELVAFLQWALPLMRMRWRGFRKVRRQVRKRLTRRMAELGIGALDSYRSRLEQHPEEWEILDRLCRITISRFYRDRGIFDRLRSTVLPELAEMVVRAGERELKVWSAGCASGEEPYTLTLIHHLELGARYPELRMRVTATDANPQVLERARRAIYAPASLKGLPTVWIDRAFKQQEAGLALSQELRAAVTFLQQDIRRQLPDWQSRFHLVLCRNLVLTYFDEEEQRRVMARVARCMARGGILVVGSHERVPEGTPGFELLSCGWPFYSRVG